MGRAAKGFDALFLVSCRALREADALGLKGREMLAQGAEAELRSPG